MTDATSPYLNVPPFNFTASVQETLKRFETLSIASRLDYARTMEKAKLRQEVEAKE